MSRLTVTSRSRRAFTLLEVLMVIVIIGLLAAFVVPNLVSTREGAKIDLMTALVKSGFNGAMDHYQLDMERYPREEDGGLQALLKAPDDATRAKRWRGPYIKAESLKDAWDVEFVYVCPGQVNTDSYDLSSNGPDREPGTDDDISNWQKD